MIIEVGGACLNHLLELGQERKTTRKVWARSFKQCAICKVLFAELTVTLENPCAILPQSVSYGNPVGVRIDKKEENDLKVPFAQR